VTFGRPSGPPASARRVEALLDLLRNAGHTDFRDARGPMGFTQRQANGTFTVDEAEQFIDRLETAEHEGAAPARADPPPRLSKAEQAVRAMPTERLAAELQRRGWAVMEP
jgi:hypothetical protein